MPFFSFLMLQLRYLYNMVAMLPKQVFPEFAIAGFVDPMELDSSNLY